MYVLGYVIQFQKFNVFMHAQVHAYGSMYVCVRVCS